MIRSRRATVLAWGVLILGALALSPAPSAQAAALSGGPATLGPVASDVADFSFDSFAADYRLGLDAADRSTLTTVETIVARFPDSDQNHGIRRVIPTRYEGHPTDIVIDGVTDENGSPRSFQTETTTDDQDREFLAVTIAADEFVHGAQTYSITYSQSNVILYPSDASMEDFYWDVNGTGWDQTFGLVTATIRFDPALVDRLNGELLCFAGPERSKQPCDDIRFDGTSVEPIVTASAADLGPRENLTVVVLFESNTFVPRDDSFTANAFPAIGLLGAILALLSALLAGVLRATRWRRAPGRFTIIAEYLPPRGINLLTAGDVTGTAGKAMAAQFISFAVRGNVRILEAGEKKNHFLLEFVHSDGVDETEQRILGTLFPGLAKGDQRDLKRKSTALSKALQKERLAARAQSLRRGLRKKKDSGARAGVFVLMVVGVGLGLAGSLGAVATVVGGLWPLVLIALVIIASVLAVVFAGNMRPLTADGAELRDYLKGVKLYIGLAEADRLRVLQSPAGAVRSVYRPEVSVPDPAVPSLATVKLYERVLPLAVLFGQEKDWSGVLSQYYTASGTQPEWYSGAGVFQAAYFAGAISSFATATTASWSGSAASSSTSGAGGGGFSGGGGGGGGGGGV